MNVTRYVAALLLPLFCINLSHADTVRFRVDVEVTKAFTGVPLGSLGTVTVQYEDTLVDQRTDEPHHQHLGLYGFPELPPVTMLWDFGGNDAVYSEQGSITVVDAPFPHSADIWAANAGGIEPEGITKGVFENFTFRSGRAVSLTDFEDAMLGSQALIPPDPSFIPMAEFNTGDVAFFGNSAFVAFKATDITLLDATAKSSAIFTAGSPVSLSQAVATPNAAFDISFDASFDSAAVTGSGALQVFLDGQLLGGVTPTVADTTLPTTIQVTDNALWGLDSAALVFQYDGPTGSTMTLDNIVIPGSDLLNGNFETQSLAAWSADGPGSVAAHITTIPEPTSALLVFVALGLCSQRRQL